MITLLSEIIISILISILLSILYSHIFHSLYLNNIKFQILLISLPIFVFIASSIGYASGDLNISIEPIKTGIIKNCPFELNIVVKWDGEPYDYLIPTPLLNLPDSFSVIDTVVSTKALVSGKQQIIFAYQIVASDIGEYKLDSLKLEYVPKGEVDKYTKNLSTITINVVFWNIGGLTLKHLAIIFCFIFILAIAGFFIIRRKRNNTKKKILEIQKGERERDFDSILEKAHAAKVSGNKLEFLENIILLKKNLNIEYDNEKELLDSLKYAGYKISKEKIEHLYRDIEHVLKNRRR